jgi:NTP pyrophosphatase (non-canonical NTP hydrolase)
VSYPISLDDRAYEIHLNARAKGFWDHEYLVVIDPVLGDVEGRPRNPSIDAEKLALIHSEVSEALEAHRDGDMDHVAEELADVIIRVLDYAQARGMSMEHAVARKMAANAKRPRLHGRSW